MDKKNKIILMAGAILIVISIALSTVSVVIMSSALKKINAPATDTIASIEGDVTLPISKTVSWQLTDPMIASIVSADPNSKNAANVSIKVIFKFEKENKEATAVLKLMQENEGLVRDRISKLLETKTYEDVREDGFTKILQQEILDLMNLEFDTDTILEVYGDILRSYR